MREKFIYLFIYLFVVWFMAGLTPQTVYCLVIEE